jgi:deazaflavin-dependent oxidoreductase (nitroreductase family)
MTNPEPTTPGSPTTRLPRWLKVANPVIVVLQHLGVAFFTFHLLSVPGRKTGQMRTTPVSPFYVEGRRYIVSLGQTQWVRNARAAGWAILARGRHRRRVRLRELGAREREPILRQFPVQIPAGVRIFVQVGVVEPPADPDAFAAAGPGLAVFELEPFDHTTE